MKATFELPDALFKEIKLRAVREGRKVKDLVEELLRKGLSAPSGRTQPETSRIGKDPITGLPVILCRHKAAPGQEATPERIAEILLEQEVEWQHEAGR